MNKLFALLSLATVVAIPLSLGGCNPQLAGQYQKWRVLLCKLKDLDTVPPDTAKLGLLFDGVDGLKQYYTDISYGNYSPEFVRDDQWATVDQTQDQDRALGRYDRIKNCMNAHGESGKGYDGVIVFRNSQIDGGNAGGQVLADLGGWNVTFLAHETGHGLGLGHSYDMSDRKNSSWSAPGEYFDFWDIMSAMAVYAFTNDNGFTAGPNMAASSKLLLGWLAPEKLVRLNAPAAGAEQKITLGRYDRGNTADLLAAVIDTGGDQFYTVEYRKQAGWDRAIPMDGVLVHQVRLGGTRPYVIDGGPMSPGQSYAAPENFRVSVNAYSPDGDRVEISVAGITPAAAGGTQVQALRPRTVAPLAGTMEKPEN